MIINHNMASLNTYRQMSTNTANTSKSLEKLSSGLRINKAGDDAAGLAISEKMRGQIRGLDQAARNGQDGISMLNTAEGALSETHSILQRMKELATQSANDTNTSSDRAEIQKEMNQLTSEINRIGNTTEFNTQKLLKGKDLPVTTTVAPGTTLAEGEAGVSQGVVDNFKVNANSIVGSASTTTVQASSKDTVGKISTTVHEGQASTKAVKSSLTLTNGISLESDNTAANYGNLNGLNVEIKQAATGSGATATTMTQAGGANTKITITIGTNASGVSLATDRGTLFNELDTAVKNFTFVDSDDKFTVKAPAGTSSAVTNVAASGTFAGGKAEIKGSYDFDITTAFKEAGDTITIAGKTFTGVTGTVADPSKRQFRIDDTTALLTGSDPITVFDLSTVVTNASTKIVITVDNKDYTIDNAALEVAGGSAISDIEDQFKNAKAADGTLLSSVATVSNTGAALEITSNNSSGVSGVKVDIQSALGADITALEGALFITDGQTDNLKDLQAASLLTAINADTDISAHYTVTNTAGTANLKFVEKDGQATGVALQKPTVAGAGTNDTLTVSDAKGHNLSSVTIKTAGTTAAAAATALFSTDLKLTAGSNGTELNGVTIKFSGTTTGAADATTKSTWDKDSSTLTVTGPIADDAEMLAAVKAGLTTAGFNSANIAGMTVAGTAANAAGATLDGKFVTFGGGEITTATDEMAVSADSKGNLTVYLATKTADKNTAAKIQTAIQDLNKNTDYKGGIDFSTFTTKAGGNWDTKTLANSLTIATGTMVGGKTEVKGDYSFEIATAFKAGDIAEVAGIKFKVVESGADATKGEFNVGTGDVNAQAAGLADAISLNATLTAKYDVAVNGFEIKLTEKVATGSDLQATNLAVKAIGTAGQYSVDTSAVSGNGGSFTIDGTEIKVSNKEANVGYANGTAIKEALNAADQTKALVEAINKNATLSVKYTASVGTDGSLLLNQNEGEETATAPEVIAKTAPIGDYKATLQVGANAGQSMTIEVADMRSAALAISGDGSVGTVAAKDGQVASYVTTANVTNGTTNINEEFALDVSSHDKATAAISVLDDAIQAVSAERSKLGAYTNRLEHTITNLGTSSENLTAAESRVRDVDMAKEMMAFQKNNILSQAAQAMMAQANQQPQGVLQLLR